MDFTHRKFLQFPLEQQHKKCAEILSVIYRNKLEGVNVENLLSCYDEMVKWMGGTKLSDTGFESLSNRYHHHLKQAGAQHKEHNLLSSIKKGDKEKAETAWPIAIYLDHLRSAHNVGSILRTIEAFSLGTVYFSEDTPFITNKQVADASMGASKWVNCIQGVMLESLPRPIIALETSSRAIPLYDFVFPKTFTLVVGNEEYGCSEKTLQAADYIVEIPLRGRKNSLNVANALAITAGEIVRQFRYKAL